MSIELLMFAEALAANKAPIAHVQMVKCDVPNYDLRGCDEQTEADALEMYHQQDMQRQQLENQGYCNAGYILVDGYCFKEEDILTPEAQRNIDNFVNQQQTAPADTTTP